VFAQNRGWEKVKIRENIGGNIKRDGKRLLGMTGKRIRNRRFFGLEKLLWGKRIGET